MKGKAWKKEINGKGKTLRGQDEGKGRGRGGRGSWIKGGRLCSESNTHLQDCTLDFGRTTANRKKRFSA